MERKFQTRKNIRLNYYDYSTPGKYFITICTKDRRNLLSSIVARGLAPAEYEIEYTKFGRIAEKQLLSLSERYPSLTIDNYVIMPNHVHVLFTLSDISAGVNPRPTIIDIVCSYKSLTTKSCKEIGLKGNLFQTSFYDHVIRNEKDYAEIYEYISNNPLKWQLDKYYNE